METRVTLEEMLHGRIITHCIPLYVDGHFRHAAREAMIQVELALKEKTGVNQYGVRLINSVLGKGNGIKLVVPFGPEMQSQARALFDAAFSYYRNYAAHDGTKIDQQHCLRIMVMASELLDLINASEVSFAEIGGVKGLVSRGLFSTEGEIRNLLKFLSNCAFPKDVPDGFFENMAEEGYGDGQLKAVIETGLVEYKSGSIKIPADIRSVYDGDPFDIIGFFALTPLGEEVLQSGEKDP